MPRRARVESKTGYYHVMMRGNNKEHIFTNDSYKRYFLKLLSKELEENILGVNAWCIMKNHVHLILHGDLQDLSKAIQKINLSFAKKYNYRNNRVGHVFQDRFKSQLIEDEEYLLQAVRYVHQNPQKAEIAEELSDYRWSSYNSFIHKRWSEDMKRVMELFRNDISLFVEFHKHTDIKEHLEVQEDVVKANLLIAKSIMKSYNQPLNRESSRQMILELCSKTNLSKKEIAIMVNISCRTVYRIANEV